MFIYGWLKDPVYNDICASTGTPWNAVEEEDNTVEMIPQYLLLVLLVLA